MDWLGFLSVILRSTPRPARCGVAPSARSLSSSTIPSGRGTGAARVPRGCRPGQPAASLRHDETSLASQFLASEQPGMPVYVV